MFIEKVKERYGFEEPIFTKELLELFSNYSRSQVFGFIKKARCENEIKQYCKGVYYIPNKTLFEYSTICADDVIQKRYLGNGNERYGIYSGIKLLNFFALTTQMAGTIEIVTNNESSKYRQIKIKNRRFILRRSRFEINKDNYAAYTILQLFTELSIYDKISEYARKRMHEYIRKAGVTKEQLFDLSKWFPSKTIKNLIGSGIISQ